MMAILLFIIGKLGVINSQLAEKTKNNESNDTDLHDSPQWYIYPSLVLGAVFLLFAFVAPYFFTDRDTSSKFSDTGQIGYHWRFNESLHRYRWSHCNGLAFFMQFEANRQQRRFFYTEQIENKKDLQEQITRQNNDKKLQQFESHFYEVTPRKCF